MQAARRSLMQMPPLHLAQKTDHQHVSTSKQQCRGEDHQRAMCGHDTDAMQLFHEEPTGYTEGREDSGHPDGAEEVQRPRKITQQKADGNQVEENPYSARKSVMGSATFAVHIANRDFDDRRALPRCQRRNETM